MQAGQEVDSTTCKGNVALIHLEETDEGESWSIHSLWILTIHSGDVAAS
jgi:hypothetical protein